MPMMKIERRFIEGEAGRKCGFYRGRRGLRPARCNETLQKESSAGALACSRKRLSTRCRRGACATKLNALVDVRLRQSSRTRLRPLAHAFADRALDGVENVTCGGCAAALELFTHAFSSPRELIGRRRFASLDRSAQG